MKTSSSTRPRHAGPRPHPGAQPGCTLADLRPGERGIIEQAAHAAETGGVGADVRPAAKDPNDPETKRERLQHRLVDLGFVPGGQVEALRRAPLGDPTIYRVADYEVALRARDARMIAVRRVAHGGEPDAAAQPNQPASDSAAGAGATAGTPAETIGR
ncbi:hypothetical protein CATYP_06770 [Corynebacterium atypicum]|uniref:Ferrous iron transporter FeoA-like domain-containing protein n=1 Tax=Corynebacterium atypicum TaxID=191610 RepID=A0ABM5QNE6_9CORY|nr:FeoA family protein [Corynebacterium atypicum]AIG64347.1 hypothetical protein CATYP_06770 [Corynebacterium atypicum]